MNANRCPLSAAELTPFNIKTFVDCQISMNKCSEPVKNEITKNKSEIEIIEKNTK